MPKKKITPKQYADVSTGVRLSSHEKLCSERMKQLHESISEVNREVKQLRQDVSKGKGAVSLRAVISTIIATTIGYFQFKG